MHGFIFGFFLNINSYPFIGVIYILLTLMILLFTFILGFTIYKRRIEYNKKKWQQNIALIISEALFSLEGEPGNTTHKKKKLIRNSMFRDCVINELIQT